MVHVALVIKTSIKVTRSTSKYRVNTQSLLISKWQREVDPSLLSEYLMTYTCAQLKMKCKFYTFTMEKVHYITSVVIT